MPEWIGDLADLLSIVGFVITVLVFAQTRALRRSFELKGRLPQLLADLQGSTETLAVILGQWPGSKNRVLAEFNKASAMLTAITDKLSIRTQKSALKALAKRLRTRRAFFWRRSLSELAPDQLWDLYYELIEAEMWLRQHDHDLRWK